MAIRHCGRASDRVEQRPWDPGKVRGAAISAVTRAVGSMQVSEDGIAIIAGKERGTSHSHFLRLPRRPLSRIPCVRSKTRNLPSTGSTDVAGIRRPKRKSFRFRSFDGLAKIQRPTRRHDLPRVVKHELAVGRVPIAVRMVYSLSLCRTPATGSSNPVSASVVTSRSSTRVPTGAPAMT